MRWLQLLLLAACSVVSGQQLLTSGRIDGEVDPATGLASLPIVMSWPGTSVRVAFDNTVSLDVTLEAQPAFSAAMNNSFRFVLDGVAEQAYISSEDLPAIWSKDGLSKGSHDLTVVKLTEALYGIVVLSNISLAPAGRCVGWKFDVPKPHVTGCREWLAKAKQSSATAPFS